MTNYEKYKDEVIRMAVVNTIAVVKGKLVRCGVTHCEDCDFDCDNDTTYCTEQISKWLDEEYVE